MTVAFCASTIPRYFRMGGVTTSMKPMNEREHEGGNQITIVFGPIVKTHTPYDFRLTRGYRLSTI